MFGWHHFLNVAPHGLRYMNSFELQGDDVLVASFLEDGNVENLKLIFYMFAFTRVKFSDLYCFGLSLEIGNLYICFPLKIISSKWPSLTNVAVCSKYLKSLDTYVINRKEGAASQYIDLCISKF